MRMVNMVMSPNADTVNGTPDSDTISGLGGSDSLNGLGGDDSLDGGSGTDRLEGSDGSDTLDGGDDNDILYGGRIFAHPDMQVGEDLLLGGAGDDRLTGGSRSDTLRGGEGRDYLDGGVSGADLLAGEAGDDTAFAVGAGSTVEGGDGDDTLSSHARSCLLDGGLGEDFLYATYNYGPSTLSGGEGDDTLASAGGPELLPRDHGRSYDRLVGGTGNDAYRVNANQDIIVELPGGGIDLVEAYVSVNLAPEVENLVFRARGVWNANGNALDNHMTGNADANRFSAGNGDDTLIGGEGYDTLIGGNGNDSLDGGTDADSMGGGHGNDTYVVDGLFDLLAEDPGAGIDHVITHIDLTLAAEFENLTLAGWAVRGTGNAANNTLVGTAMANRLRGLDGNDAIQGGAGADTIEGGAGNDVLTGGDGADRFRLEGAGVGFDRIVDFNPDADVLEVSAAAYGGFLPLGPVGADRFALGYAEGSAPQFVYVPATGALRWDADGAGGVFAVTVAMLTGMPMLDESDIVVVA
jgi:Ca2+-binding RTX toxin-like protein